MHEAVEMHIRIIAKDGTGITSICILCLQQKGCSSTKSLFVTCLPGCQEISIIPEIQIFHFEIP